MNDLRCLFHPAFFARISIQNKCNNLSRYGCNAFGSSHKYMVIRPTLTRVNAIIARGLLGASVEQQLYLLDAFRIRLPMLAHGWKSSSFTFSRQLDVFFKLPISFPLSYSLLFLPFLFVPSCSSFFSCKTGAFSGNMFPLNHGP